MAYTTDELAAQALQNTTRNRKNTGDLIRAEDLSLMAQELEYLSEHSHTFYDDYATACNCNCQCNCNRGIL